MYVGERASRENENEGRSDEHYCYDSSLRSSSVAQRAVIWLTLFYNNRYSGLRISLNCLVSEGMAFAKLGGKQSSVRFMAVSDDGPVCVILKVKPELLDKFHETLVSCAK